MVQTSYNPALVALSIAIAIFAAYTALDLEPDSKANYRASRLTPN